MLNPPPSLVSQTHATCDLSQDPFSDGWVIYHVIGKLYRHYAAHNTATLTVVSITPSKFLNYSKYRQPLLIPFRYCITSQYLQVTTRFAKFDKNGQQQRDNGNRDETMSNHSQAQSKSRRRFAGTIRWHFSVIIFLVSIYFNPNFRPLSRVSCACFVYGNQNVHFTTFRFRTRL